MRIRFNFEWEDPGKARGSELRATWARLEIWVEDVPITHVVDHQTRAYRTGVYLPLYPVAEWLAQNWFFLFHEVGSKATRHYQGALPQQHNLRFAGEGFALPSLQFLPTGDSVELRWEQYKAAYRNAQFIEAGRASVSLESLKNELARFIDAVIERLVRENVTSMLQEDWLAIQSLERSEEAFARAAAAFGIDPFETTQQQEKLLIQAAESVPSETLNEFLTASRSKDLGAQIAWFSSARSKLEPVRSQLNELPKLARSLLGSLPSAEATPFERGYGLARSLRKELGINGQPIPGLEHLVRKFGQFDRLDASGIVIASDKAQPIHALSLLDLDGEKPRFLLTREREDSRRFALSRSICDFLLRPTHKADIVADSYYDKDKASRAFAAEFLAPSEGLRARLSDQQVDEDKVADLAEEFGVSTLVIENQIENHHLA